MARMRRKRTRRSFMPYEVVITPLVDTALTLVVILMVAAPMVNNGIKITLPSGKSKEIINKKQQDLVVLYRKDSNGKDEFFFNSYPVERLDLVETVKKELINNDEIPVFIKADAAVPYGNVISIVDDLKIAGVKYVGMSMKPIEKSS